MGVALEEICREPKYQLNRSNRLEVTKVQSLITLAFLDAHIWAWIEGVQKVGQD